jgi:hypothetical protein
MESNFRFNNEDDFMEIGETGWVPAGQGTFINRYNGHILDELGREYDREGNLIYDPEDNNDDIN